MANIVEQFIQNIRGLSQKSPEELQEMAASQERREAINARSGDNIRFYDGTELSDNYKNTLMDAIKFYQDEFKVTPHATIGSDPDYLDRRYGSNVAGTASLLGGDDFGQHEVNLRNLKQSQEEAATLSAQRSTKHEWWPKNSGDISAVPIHELGHVLFETIFPGVDTSSTRQGIYEDGEFYPVLADDIYFNALGDLGVNDGDTKKAVEKTKEISRYANTNPDETIAEALVDYYYNRNNAADLSKAIINRLKSAGSMYGIKQTGGFDLDRSARNFIKNLRRYRVIQ